VSFDAAAGEDFSVVFDAPLDPPSNAPKPRPNAGFAMAQNLEAIPLALKAKVLQYYDVRLAAPISSGFAPSVGSCRNFFHKFESIRPLNSPEEKLIAWL
jgi:hypothetical protein